MHPDQIAFGLNTDASYNNNSSTMQLPAQLEVRAQLLDELHRAKRAQRIIMHLVAGSGSSSAHTESNKYGPGANSSSVVYVVPTKMCTDSMEIDFAAVCVSPPVENGGLRSMESRIEPMSLPTNNVAHSAHILNTFERKVLRCMLVQSNLFAVLLVVHVVLLLRWLL
jgi:hypothetical protein